MWVVHHTQNVLNFWRFFHADRTLFYFANGFKFRKISNEQLEPNTKKN